jgi:hypothetical protein
MPEPQNPFRGRASAPHDKRTAAQVDAHVRARAHALTRRVADRPVVRVSAARIDAQIARHIRTLRMKRPEAPGT